MTAGGKLYAPFGKCVIDTNNATLIRICAPYEGLTEVLVGDPQIYDSTALVGEKCVKGTINVQVVESWLPARTIINFNPS